MYGLSRKQLEVALGMLLLFNIGLISNYISKLEYRRYSATANERKYISIFRREEVEPNCPVNPSGLVENIKWKRHDMKSQLKNMTKEYRLGPGGHHTPPCISHNRTAIIVPYRNRTKDLDTLLIRLIPFLIKQQTEFAIFVIEPKEELTFNRALLMNIGYTEALKVHNFNCFIFHDVDVFPENEHNLYRCQRDPRHFTVALRKFKYRLPYKRNCGGVVGVSKSTYADINGMSNLFFGWGGEDDDLYIRLMYKNYTLLRYDASIGRYDSYWHRRDKGNEKSLIRYYLYNVVNRIPNVSQHDGLNSLKYVVLQRDDKLAYTRILIDLDMKYYNKLLKEKLKLYKPYEKKPAKPKEDEKCTCKPKLAMDSKSPEKQISTKT